MKKSIVLALEVFRRYPGATHEEMVEHLKSAVGDDDLAERLMEFVPIAYARIALANTGVRFQDTFCRSLGNGEVSHFCPLSSEPLWEPSTAVVMEELVKDIPEADHLAVLTRSALYNCYRQGIESGADMQDASMSPSVLLRPAPMPCEPRPKHWWKFW